MLNVLSYVGMNMQSEVCLWTLLGLLRTIFDATLFKVNANLKQVWQMGMPVEISLPVQRVLRTMISGIMLVQCFTVYIYLATYIVLLYPAFLEERPTLVLPWLLLAAIRKLLCELLSLALGLGTCVLVGAARPPCVKFVVVKIVSIMPSVYMWMLVLNYYNALKVASVLQSFPKSVPTDDLDYGLELAVRRRRTKSLQGEAQLRRRLLSHWYEERPENQGLPALTSPVSNINLPHSSPSETNDDTEKKEDTGNVSDYCRVTSAIGTYEDWFGNEIAVPRNTDRIAEQFVLMLMRIGAYLRKTTKLNDIKMFESPSHQISSSPSNAINLETCPALTDHTDETPHLVGSSKENTASYLRLYPQIFMKGNSEYQSLRKFESVRTVRSSMAGKLEPSVVDAVASAASKKNTILLEEKGTNSTRVPSVENMFKEQNEGCTLYNNTTQQPQSSNEMNVSDKVNVIKSHDSISSKNLSIDSDSSLNALIAKMQLQIAEIISVKEDASTSEGEGSSQLPNTPRENS